MFRILALLVPPIRLLSRQLNAVDKVWIPFYGWSLANEKLELHVKSAFSRPILIIAFLIIPILLVEWFFVDALSALVGFEIEFF
ncbi:MAG: hypothetical protein LAT68_09700 [Cyclobacteriaceae bacterium]|nr:hypothetical protein [Cyclobacteriaceae bacterium]